MTEQPYTDAAVRSPGPRPTAPLAAEPRPSEPEPVESVGRSSGTAFAEAGVALLGELESSLEASQHALLARDLAGIERHTGEQVRLRRALEILWSQNSLEGSDRVPIHPMLSVRAGAAEFGAAELRVLQLGRVQAALLRRAQRWSRMLSHVLAGPGAGYAAPAGDSTVLHPAWPSTGGGGAMARQQRRGQEKPRPENSYPPSAEAANPETTEERDPCRV
ncbi:MAG: hypothetical protein ABSG72_02235 [Candidatus Sulfotelmatobacter sp.]